MKFLRWLLRAFLFFTLFAFALNNQDSAQVHWFFGYVWSAPMVVIVAVTFAAGAVTGVLAMTPSWWRQWRLAAPGRRPAAEPPATAPDTSAPPQLPPDAPTPRRHGS
ncbi:LapA family protein [Ideonella livida]|uniref:LapA family protein n=1 Tax=Ideonella livida TaxID=2707176 RepID=A0A7C9TIC6_9BURK|nr:LapA family protein [Ideonella livida]NDY90163.1 LapA family protein [Ideonella livida]